MLAGHVCSISSLITTLDCSVVKKASKIVQIAKKDHMKSQKIPHGVLTPYYSNLTFHNFLSVEIWKDCPFQKPETASCREGARVTIDNNMAVVAMFFHLSFVSFSKKLFPSSRVTVKTPVCHTQGSK